MLLHWNKEKVIHLVISIGICQLTGLIGSFFTRQSLSSWYALLAKPPFTPPSSAFAPVWIVLFTLMGISIFIIWECRNYKERISAIFPFTLQLSFNTLWSIVFFGMRSISGGLLVLIPLWFSIFATIKIFHRISRLAAYLMVPYLLWVSFAAVLNFYIWKLNR
jgi:tryptophan-rich sensory protein